ncbi:MAG TPA: CRISPR-associated endoribonuclease Cas6 [Thermodesulfobacteriota bacterium]|nr:CRISPR-associated endoribonuclease Cas6 [Thermodesulfobacteriota bacterium]
MITKLSLELNSNEEIQLPGLGGETLYGLFLNLLKAQDSNLASSLHNTRETKPVTVSPFVSGAKLTDGRVVLEPDSKASFQISFFTDSPTEAFMLALNKALGNRKPANLGGKEIKLSNMKMIKVTNFKELANQAKSEGQISLRFLSPTSFRSHGGQKVFPEPNLVFSSLLKKWNAFSSIKFPKELEEEFSKIRVTRYNTRTELVEFSNYKIIGFKGTCSYELPKGMSDETKKQINTLADFAFFAGVGYKTTMGMGQTVRL